MPSSLIALTIFFENLFLSICETGWQWLSFGIPMSKLKNHGHMECRPVVFSIESGDHSGQECEESPDWTWFVNVFEFANPHSQNGPHSVIADSGESSLTASVRNGQSWMFCTLTWRGNRENIRLYTWNFKSPTQLQKQDFRLTVSHC